MINIIRTVLAEQSELDLYVVYTGPQNPDRTAYTGRLDRAIRAIRRSKSDYRLILVGDANGGDDLRALRVHAIKNGIPENRLALLSNEGQTNTLGDSRVVAREIHPILANDQPIRVHVVTCWYHVRRARIILQGELAKLGAHTGVNGIASYGRIPLGLLSFKSERKGVADYLAGKPNVPSGTFALYGKPKPGVKPVI